MAGTNKNTSENRGVSVIEWTKRVGKSVAFGAFEAFTEQMPVMTNMVASNKETAREMFKKITDFKSSSDKLSKLQDQYVFKPANQMFKNIKESIKTGNFYSKERAAAAEEEAMSSMMEAMLGEDIMAEANGEAVMEPMDDDPTRLRGIPEVTKGDMVIASVAAREVRTSTNCIAKTLISTTEAGIKASRTMSNIQLQQQQAHTQVVQMGFGQVTRGINSIIEFNNEVVLQHAKNSQIFYEKMVQLTTENNSILKEMIEMKRNLYKNSIQANDDKSNEKKVIENGIFNLRGYMDNVMKQAEGPMQMVTMFIPMMQTMMQQIIANPLHFASKQLIETMLGPAFKLALRKFDKSMEGFLFTGLSKLADYGRNTKFGNNTILPALAKMFGYKEETPRLRTLDTSKFVRGAATWQNSDHIALTHVIPELLSNMESLMGGSPRFFDYKTGKWSDRRNISGAQKALDKQGRDMALGEFEHKIKTAFDNVFQFKDAKDLHKNRKDIAEMMKGLYEFGRFDIEDIKKNSNNKYGKNQAFLQQFLEMVNSGYFEPSDLMGVAASVARTKSNINKNLGAQGIESGADFLAATNATGLSNPASGIASKYQSTLLDYQDKILNTLYEIRDNTSGLFGRIFGGGKRKGGSSGGGTPPSTPPSGGSSYNVVGGSNHFANTLVDEIIHINDGSGTYDKQEAVLNSLNPNDQKKYIKNLNIIMKAGFDRKGMEDIEKAKAEIVKIVSSYEGLRGLVGEEGAYSNPHSWLFGDVEVNRGNQYGQDMYQNMKRKMTLNDKVNNSARLNERALKAIREKAGMFQQKRTDEELRYSGGGLFQEISNFFGMNTMPSESLPYGVRPDSPLIEQLAQAATIGDKIQVLSANISQITQAPKAAVVSMMATADKLMYETLFKKETGEVDENGRPINGLFDKMLSEIGKAGTKLNEKLTDVFGKFVDSKDTILDKIYQHTGIDVATPFNKIREMVTGIKDNAKEAASASFDVIKNAVKGTAADIGVINNADSKAAGGIGGGLTFLSKGETIIDNFGKSKPARVNKGGLAYVPYGSTILNNNQSGGNANIWDQANQEKHMKQSLLNKLNVNNTVSSIGSNARGNEVFNIQGLFDQILQAYGPEGMEDIVYMLMEKMDMDPTRMARKGASKVGRGAKKVFNKFFGDIKDTREIRDILLNVLDDDLLRDNPDLEMLVKDFARGAGYKGRFESEEDRTTRELEGGGLWDMTRQLTMKAFGQDPNKAAEETKDYIIKNTPEIMKGSILGALSSVVFPVGGPLMGALAGTSVELLKKNESFMSYVFGNKIAENERDNTGLISNDFMKSLEKYIPDMKKYGITGALAGMITPFGPLGGVMAGVAASYIKNNERANEFIFGPKDGSNDEAGLLSKKRREKLKKALPKIGAAAALGVLLGPVGFGLLGNAALGAGLGLLSTTDRFKDIVLGPKDRRGNRYGGLAGAIRREITEPFKKSMQEMRSSISKWFKNEVFNPIGKALRPIGKLVGEVFKSMGKSIYGLIRNKLKGTFLDRMFSKAFGFLRKGGGLLKNAIGGIAKKVVGVPVGALSALGRGAERQLLKRGISYGDETETSFDMLKRMDELGMSKNGTMYKFADALAKNNDRSVIANNANAFRTLAMFDKGGDMAVQLKDQRNQKHKEMYSFLSGITQRDPNIDPDFHDKLMDHFNAINDAKSMDQRAELLNNFGKFLENNHQKYNINSDLQGEIEEELRNYAGEINKIDDRIKLADGGGKDSKAYQELYKTVRDQFGNISDDEFRKNLSRFADLSEREVTGRQNRINRTLDEAEEKGNIADTSALEPPDFAKANLENNELNNSLKEQTDATQKLTEVMLGLTNVTELSLGNLRNSAAFQYDATNLINKDNMTDANVDFARRMEEKRKYQKNQAFNASIDALGGEDVFNMGNFTDEAKYKLFRGNNSRMESIKSATGFNQRENAIKSLMGLNKAAETGNAGIIDDIDAIMEIDDSGKLLQRVAQLTALGYTLPPDTYRELNEVSDAGFGLIMQLAKRGVKFVHFDNFKDIKSKKDPVYKGMLELADVKLNSFDKDGNVLESKNMSDAISADKMFEHVTSDEYQANLRHYGSWQKLVDEQYDTWKNDKDYHNRYEEDFEASQAFGRVEGANAKEQMAAFKAGKSKNISDITSKFKGNNWYSEGTLDMADEGDEVGMRDRFVNAVGAAASGLTHVPGLGNNDTLLRLKHIREDNQYGRGDDVEGNGGMYINTITDINANIGNKVGYKANKVFGDLITRLSEKAVRGTMNDPTKALDWADQIINRWIPIFKEDGDDKSKLFQYMWVVKNLPDMIDSGEIKDDMDLNDKLMAIHDGKVVYKAPYMAGKIKSPSEIKDYAPVFAGMAKDKVLGMFGFNKSNATTEVANAQTNAEGTGFFSSLASGAKEYWKNNKEEIKSTVKEKAKNLAKSTASNAAETVLGTKTYNKVSNAISAFRAQTSPISTAGQIGGGMSVGSAVPGGSSDSMYVPTPYGIKEYRKSSADGQMMEVKSKGNIEVEKLHQADEERKDRMANALESIAAKIDGIGGGSGEAKKEKKGLFAWLKDLLLAPLLGIFGPLVKFGKGIWNLAKGAWKFGGMIFKGLKRIGPFLKTVFGFGKRIAKFLTGGKVLETLKNKIGGLSTVISKLLHKVGMGRTADALNIGKEGGIKKGTKNILERVKGSKKAKIAALASVGVLGAKGLYNHFTDDNDEEENVEEDNRSTLEKAEDGILDVGGEFLKGAAIKAGANFAASRLSETKLGKRIGLGKFGSKSHSALSTALQMGTRGAIGDYEDADTQDILFDALATGASTHAGNVLWGEAIGDDEYDETLEDEAAEAAAEGKKKKKKESGEEESSEDGKKKKKKKATNQSKKKRGKKNKRKGKGRNKRHKNAIAAAAEATSENSKKGNRRRRRKNKKNKGRTSIPEAENEEESKSGGLLSRLGDVGLLGIGADLLLGGDDEDDEDSDEEEDEGGIGAMGIAASAAAGSSVIGRLLGGNDDEEEDSSESVRDLMNEDKHKKKSGKPTANPKNAPNVNTDTAKAKGLMNSFKEAGNKILDVAKKFCSGETLEAVKGFLGKITKFLFDPKNLPKLLKAAAKSAGRFALSATGIGTIFVVGLGVYEFQSGYSSADKMLDLPDGSATFMMKLACGAIAAFGGFFPFLDDMILDWYKNEIRQDLDDIRKEKEKEDKDSEHGGEGGNFDDSMSYDEYSKSILNATKSVVGGIIAGASDVGQNVAGTVANLASSTSDWVSSKATAAYDTVKSGLSRGVDYVKDKVSNGVQWAKEVGSKTMEQGKKMLNSIGEFGSSLYDKITGNGKGKYGRGGEDDFSDVPIYDRPDYDNDSKTVIDAKLKKINDIRQSRRNSSFIMQDDPEIQMNLSKTGEMDTYSTKDVMCGPAAMLNDAISLGKFNGDSNTVKRIMSDLNNSRPKDDGVPPSAISTKMKSLGIDNRMTKDKSLMESQIDNGGIFMGINPDSTDPYSPFDKGMHYVHALGRDGNGNVVFQDSQSIDGQAHSMPAKDFIQQTDTAILNQNNIPEYNRPDYQNDTRNVIRAKLNAINNGFGKYGKGPTVDEDPPFSSVASAIAQKVGSDHPELFWAQMMYETGGPDQVKKDIARIGFDDYNYGGFTWYPGMGENYKGAKRPSSEGGYYAKFSSDGEYADMAFRKVFQSYKDEIKEASDPETFARILKKHGYYEGSESDYVAGLKSLLNRYKDKIGNIKNAHPAEGGYNGGTGGGSNNGNNSSGNNNTGLLGFISEITTGLRSLLWGGTSSFNSSGGSSSGGSNGNVPSSGGGTTVTDTGIKFNGDLANRTATNRIIVHHTGPGDASTDPDTKTIDEWHKKNGWAGIGYHFVIRKNGSIERGRPEGAIGSHAQGANSDSIGIHVGGNFEEFEPTAKQIESLIKLMQDLCAKYKIPADRKHIIGHKEVCSTSCPGKNLYSKLDDIVAKVASGKSTSTPNSTTVNASTPAATTAAPAQQQAVTPSNSSPTTGAGGDTNIFAKPYDISANSKSKLTQNNIDYLLKNGYSMEQAVKTLTQEGGNKYGFGKYGKDKSTGNDGAKLWQYMKSKGLSNQTTAGILGNFMAESALYSDRLQNHSPSDGSDSCPVDGRTGYGLAQWTYNTRQQALKNFASSQGKSDSDWQAQIDFMLSGKDGNVGPLFQTMDSQTPEQAAITFHDQYERSADSPEKKQRRGVFAKEFFDKQGQGVSSDSSFSGGSSSGGASSGGSSGGGGFFGALMQGLKTMVMENQDNPVFRNIAVGAKLFGIDIFGDNKNNSGGGGANNNGGGTPVNTGEYTDVPSSGSAAEALCKALGGAPITSKFGPRTPPCAGASSFHRGIDIGVENVKLPAVVDCTIDDVRTGVSGYGNMLVMKDKKGNYHFYAHLTESIVKKGDTVNKGSIVAVSGNTGIGSGPHLHYGIYDSSNPTCYGEKGMINPMEYNIGGLSSGGNKYGRGKDQGRKIVINPGGRYSNNNNDDAAAMESQSVLGNMGRIRDKTAASMTQTPTKPDIVNALTRSTVNRDTNSMSTKDMQKYISDNNINLSNIPDYNRPDFDNDSMDVLRSKMSKISSLAQTGGNGKYGKGKYGRGSGLTTVGTAVAEEATDSSLVSAGLTAAGMLNPLGFVVNGASMAYDSANRVQEEIEEGNYGVNSYNADSYDTEAMTAIANGDGKYGRRKYGKGNIIELGKEMIKDAGLDSVSEYANDAVNNIIEKVDAAATFLNPANAYNFAVKKALDDSGFSTSEEEAYQKNVQRGYATGKYGKGFNIGGFFGNLFNGILGAFGINTKKSNNNMSLQSKERFLKENLIDIDVNKATANDLKKVFKKIGIKNIPEMNRPDFNRDDISVLRAKARKAIQQHNERVKKEAENIEAKNKAKLASQNKSTATGNEPVEKEIAPNGLHYTKNDVDYLISKGYTREDAIKFLSTDKKYTEKPKESLKKDPEVTKEEKPKAFKGGFTINGKQYSYDIPKVDKTKKELDKKVNGTVDATKVKNTNSFVDSKPKLKPFQAFLANLFGLNPAIFASKFKEDEKKKKNENSITAAAKKDNKQDKKEEPVEKEVAPNGKHYTKNDVDYLISKGYTREDAIKLLSKEKKYTEKPEVGPNGREYSKNDIDYLISKGYTREDAIKFLSTDKKYTEKYDPNEEAKKQDSTATDKKEAPKKRKNFLQKTMESLGNMLGFKKSNKSRDDFYKKNGKLSENAKKKPKADAEIITKNKGVDLEKKREKFLKDNLIDLNVDNASAEELKTAFNKIGVNNIPDFNKPNFAEDDLTVLREKARAEIKKHNERIQQQAKQMSEENKEQIIKEAEEKKKAAEAVKEETKKTEETTEKSKEEAAKQQQPPGTAKSPAAPAETAAATTNSGGVSNNKIDTLIKLQSETNNLLGQILAALTGGNAPAKKEETTKNVPKEDNPYADAMRAKQMLGIVGGSKYGVGSGYMQAENRGMSYDSILSGMGFLTSPNR